MIQKVISGGQTGVDRAGLEAAIALGIPIGGFCPKGRRAEDGIIPERYKLEETTNSSYSFRTEKNVELADVVLLMSPFPLSGGSKLTLEIARDLKKHLLQLDLKINGSREFYHLIKHVEKEKNLLTLMVAGPRESKHPGIFATATSRIYNLLFEVYL